MDSDKQLEIINHNNRHLDLDHLGYKMLMSSFKNNDIHKGLQRTLFFVKMFTQSSDVILYKMDKYGNYNMYYNGSVYLKNNDWLNILIRQGRKIIESKKVYYFECGDISSDKDVFLIPLLSHNSKYIVAIKNCNIENLYKNEKFIKTFNESMNVILDRLEQFDKINKKTHKDEQTGLENRNAYEDTIKQLDNSSEPYIYVLFDLFRLKYINDNYSYLLGDAYIFKVAEILKKYFPKYHTYRDTDGTIKKDRTGSCVYKLGGDEFVLINKNEPLSVIENKISLIQEEVESIDLNVSEELCLGINYGIACRTNNETIREITLMAGDNMKEDKAKMYKKFGVDRRR